LAVPTAVWVGLVHPEITPPSNFHQLRDTTLAPIAAVYAVTYHRYISVNPNELESEKGKTIGRASALTQSGIVFLFCLILILSPIYFFPGPGVIDDASIFVGGVETIFGAFIARTFGLLFPSEILGEAMKGDTPSGQ